MLTLKPPSNIQSRLHESTAWLYLHQDIYISLVTQGSPRTNLEEFIRFYDATEDDDFGWAKKIVLLVARALFVMNYDLPSSEKMNRWHELNELVEQWHSNKPSSFLPIYQSPDKSSENRLPEIWALSPVHGMWLHI